MVRHQHRVHLYDHDRELPLCWWSERSCWSVTTSDINDVTCERCIEINAKRVEFQFNPPKLTGKVHLIVGVPLRDDAGRPKTGSAAGAYAASICEMCDSKGQLAPLLDGRRFTLRVPKVTCKRCARTIAVYRSVWNSQRMTCGRFYVLTSPTQLDEALRAMVEW